ncbi:uncharacterized protein LOC117180482 [Belonocnema kinseyi]|uniref:uncharacterized protein LOC117180482 n=1 Tax=Belonocnema kinseyi TaxID=2817044 RepID=UPI00143DE001|nr:uncharacterized protein LOC117180482 [Belonocnema kinseyi]
MLIQLLWKAGVQWDSSIPVEVHSMWLKFKEQLPLLEEVNFRHLIIASNSIELQMHGFCEASEKTYGACIYLRSTDNQGKHHIALVCSKSRVAPVKPVTLPRLELSAALLLARLCTAVKQALEIEIKQIYLWSDSTITLNWIDTEPHLLKTFVANRVAEIQNLATSYKRTIIAIPICTKENQIDQKLVERCSSFKKLKLVVAYIRRFVHNAKNPTSKSSGPITISELEAANCTIITTTQLATFPKEIHSLKNENDLDKKSRLIPLKQFLDKHGILRVGGRLKNSDLPKEQKHPIILPPHHHVTRLIIREEHERLKHSVPQATLYSVREIFWLLNGRNITRLIIHQCVRCFRAKPRGMDYVMGNLPQERVSYSRLFLNVGVGYCGPLRGISKSIHSNNATNFVGANRELIDLYKLFQSTEHNKIVKEFLNQQKITWNFIPPRSPHFGGLWEAAVKSFKHHLSRTVGDTLLTFEQLETCIIEIEVILNSRPLSPMSSDPNDLQPLTPGHFLIGGPLTSFPQMNFKDTAYNRLSVWQHAQKLRQHFWTRWQKEYLYQLTVRSKWQSSSNHCIKLGTMVVIKEDNLPPLHWKLGRIVAIHPGPDGIIRVATVKTDTGEYKRCIKKLCPLPIEPLSRAAEEVEKSSQ